MATLGFLHVSWASSSGLDACRAEPSLEPVISVISVISGLSLVRRTPAGCLSSLLFSSFLESCPGKLIEIHGKAGLFLEGQIHPELEGVEIVISEKGASSPLITVFTDDKGAYRYVSKEKPLAGFREPPEAGWASWGRDLLPSKLDTAICSVWVSFPQCWSPTQ